MAVFPAIKKPHLPYIASDYVKEELGIVGA
jgi:hypothetical protein